MKLVHVLVTLLVILPAIIVCNKTFVIDKEMNQIAACIVLKNDDDIIIIYPTLPAISFCSYFREPHEKVQKSFRGHVKLEKYQEDKKGRKSACVRIQIL